MRGAEGTGAMVGPFPFPFASLGLVLLVSLLVTLEESAFDDGALLLSLLEWGSSGVARAAATTRW